MTCIVGIRAPGAIVIAADSCIFDVTTKAEWLSRAKIRQVGRVVAAGAGDVAVLTTFLDSLTAKDWTAKPRALAARLRECAEECDKEDSCSDVLIATGGDLWAIDTTGSFVRPSQHYVACGAGTKAALGALYVRVHDVFPTDDEAELYASDAILAAASCCDGVRPPAIVMSTRRLP